MKRIFLCSPWAGATSLNLAYLRLAIRDSLSRGEAPFAPHAIYTQVLDDQKELERSIGFQAGLVWLDCTPYVGCYGDLGISPGMRLELDRAAKLGWVVEMRTVPGFEDWFGKRQ